MKEWQKCNKWKNDGNAPSIEIMISASSIKKSVQKEKLHKV